MGFKDSGTDGTCLTVLYGKHTGFLSGFFGFGIFLGSIFQVIFGGFLGTS